MEPYKKLVSEDVSDLSEVVRDINKKRQIDIEDFNNLNNKFLTRSNRTPTASTNVLSSDTVNSFSYDPSTGYLYVLGNNAGTVQWRRVQLSTF